MINFGGIPEIVYMMTMLTVKNYYSNLKKYPNFAPTDNCKNQWIQI